MSEVFALFPNIPLIWSLGQRENKPNYYYFLKLLGIGEENVPNEVVHLEPDF